MKTMPEEMTFAASIVTLGSMLLFVFGMFYGINNSLNWSLILMLFGGLMVIGSSILRIFGAIFRNVMKIYDDEDSNGKIEKGAGYLLILIGLIVFVIGLIPFVYNFIFLQ